MISTASKPQTEIFTTDLHFIPRHFALWDNLATAFGKDRPAGIIEDVVAILAALAIVTAPSMMQ